MKAHRIAAILAVSSFCLAGCMAGGTPAGKGHDVTSDLTGPAATVTAAPGDTIILRLSENPSTGFAWERVAPLPDGLVELESTYVQDPVEPDPSGDIPTGVGGTRVITYRCDRATSGQFDFKYYQPWDKQNPAEERRATLTCR